MSTATITSKGQLTIPKKVRESMHVGSGDRIEFIKIDNEHYEIFALSKDIQKLKGIVKSKNKTSVSIDDMNIAIANMGQ